MKSVQKSEIIKEQLRFEDLEKEVFEPSKTLVITDSDVDGTKCSQILKEKFPQAEYFYVDTGIVSAGSTTPSKGNVYEVFDESGARLVIIADIDEVYFWKDLILRKVEKNHELKIVIFDHHYLIRVRKTLAHSVPALSYEHYDSPEGRRIRRAFYTLNQHPRISFYWGHVSDTFPMVRKWIKGELDHVLRRIRPTTIYVYRYTDKIVPKDKRRDHLIWWLGLSEDQVKKGQSRIDRMANSAFVKARIEFIE